MTKYLALNILLGLAIISFVMGQGPSSCDLTLNFLYQSNCIPKTCMTGKIARMTLAEVDPQVANKGVLSQGIAYAATADPNGGFNVLIRYKDDKNNPLVSDPINCLDWRVYQTLNSYEIDKTRLNNKNPQSNLQGEVPSWPVSTYNFVGSEAQISYKISLDDLSGKKCLKLKADTSLNYQCFFELAFIVKGVTQVSYYFCVTIRIQTNLDTSTTNTVQFTRIIQVTGCQEVEVNMCSVSKQIDSTITFCNDKDCAQNQATPYGPLYLNKVFYLMHQITDKSYWTNWVINQVTLTMQANGFKLVLSPSEFDITKHVPGYNIYKLSVPIVAANVVISVKAVLDQQRRMLGDRNLQDKETSGVNTNIDVGQVLVEPVDTTMSNSSSSASSLLTLNTALYLTGGTLLFSLID